MKKPLFLAVVLLTLAGCPSPTPAAPAHNSQTKATQEPRYAVNVTASAWEGVSVRVKLTLARYSVTNNTPVANSPIPSVIGLRANSLKSGIYTATVTLLRTDLLTTDARNQIQTVLEYGMHTYGGAIVVISVGDYAYPKPFSAPHGDYDISMAWGKDVSQIPDLPFGKDYFARYHIGDTCKIVFYLGPDAASYVVKSLPLATHSTEKFSQDSGRISIDFSFISQLEGKQQLKAYSLPPKFSKSGVTVATGIDLGQMSPDEINRLNISAPLKTELLRYTFPLRGPVAIAFLKSHPLNLLADQANALDKAYIEYKINPLPRKYNAATTGTRFEDLPGDAQTAIAAVAYQYGGNLAKPKAAPKFWADVTQQRWNDAIVELRNFNDGPILQARHNKEANLLQRAISNGGL